MKIIICDDELFARQQIKEAIQKCPSHYPLELYEFDSGEKMLRELKEQHIDMIFWILRWIRSMALIPLNS